MIKKQTKIHHLNETNKLYNTVLIKQAQQLLNTEFEHTTYDFGYALTSIKSFLGSTLLADTVYYLRKKKTNISSSVSQEIDSSIHREIKFNTKTKQDRDIKIDRNETVALGSLRVLQKDGNLDDESSSGIHGEETLI